MTGGNHHFCEDYDQSGVCVLLRERRSGVCLADLICDVDDLPCSKKGDCGKAGSCVAACRRFAAYRVTAGVLGYREREPLPICVRLFITDRYGESVTGFKQE